MKLDSPLRYPGGKAFLAAFLSKTLQLNGLSDCSYYEPFAGGAGAALSLLRSNVVSQLYLNDLDPGIVSFWRAALYESKRFAEAIHSVHLSIAEWKRQLEICRLANLDNPFELGFATFFLNRCNRSGIILGAAPIGGYNQTGKWKMDARFYRKTLADRILAIGEYRERIHVSHMDALEFLVDKLPPANERASTFVYLDPPYHEKGDRLYMNVYDDQDHRNLATFIQDQCSLKWMTSYDDTPFVRDLYELCHLSKCSLKYSLQRKREAEELIIFPQGMSHPNIVVDPAQ